MRNLEKFDLASLATIDGGRIAIAFAQALERVARDCYDRPGEKKERGISLSLAVKPRMDENGMCEDCDVQVTVHDNVPKRKSKVYSMSLSKGQNLLFHEESLDDHSQEVLDFGADD